MDNCKRRDYCRHRHHRRRQQHQMKSYFWVCCASTCYLLMLLVQGVSCRSVITATSATPNTGRNSINVSNDNNDGSDDADIINHIDAVLTQNSTESSNSSNNSSSSSSILLDTELLEYFSRSDNDNDNDNDNDEDEDEDEDENDNDNDNNIDHEEDDNEQSLSSSSFIPPILSSLGGVFNFNNFIRKKNYNHHHNSYETSSATRMNVVDPSRVLANDNEYYENLNDRNDDDDGCDEDDDCDYPSSQKDNNQVLTVSESPTASDSSWWDASIKDLVFSNNDKVDIAIDINVSVSFPESESEKSESESVDEDDSNVAAVQQPTPIPQPTLIPTPWNPNAIRHRPRNSIVIRINMGLVHLEQLTTEESRMITQMCLRALTVVFNESKIPFLMTDEYAFSVAEKERDASNRLFQYREGDRQRALQDNDQYGDSTFIKSPLSSSAWTSSSLYGEQQQQQRREERNDGAEDFDDDIIINGFNEDVVDTSIEDKEDGHIAKLVLHNLTITLSNPSPGNDWWELQAIYTVWRNPIQPPPNNQQQRDVDHWQQKQQMPVINRNILNKMEYICGKTIDDAIDSGQFWSTIRSIEFGDQNFILSPPYYLDDKGLGDCMDRGDQYDLSPSYCQSFKPTTTGNGGSKDKETNACVMEDSNLPTPPPRLFIDNEDGPSRDIQTKKPDDCPDCDFASNATFPEVIADSPLQVDWTIREWVGFGLMVTTIVFVVSLSSIAHIISKRRTEKRLWGAAMTQEGIDDILQVGWRYHEQTEQRQQQQQLEDDEDEIGGRKQQELLHAQLFLQIYDKGIGPGYNEENSILKGGVERIDDINYYRPNAPPPVSTTAPTTSTPPPPSNNINDVPPPEPFRPQYPD
jgi:hypothetical protein